MAKDKEKKDKDHQGITNIVKRGYIREKPTSKIVLYTSMRLCPFCHPFFDFSFFGTLDIVALGGGSSLW